MKIFIEQLRCGCHSWIESVDVHVQACRTPGHYAALVSTARFSGLPVSEVDD